MEELHDRVTYRIVVAVLGGALIVSLIGICTIVALDEASEIPKQLWTTISALGGGLLGLLVPAPTEAKKKTAKSQDQQVVKKKLEPLWVAMKCIRNYATVIILLIVFGVAVWQGATQKSTELQALAGASGAALIGLLAPSPTQARKPQSGDGAPKAGIG